MFNVKRMQRNLVGEKRKSIKHVDVGERGMVKLLKLQTELQELMRGVNVAEMVTPTNLAEQHEEWIKKANEGLLANPCFVYDAKLLETVAEKQKKVEDLYGKILERWPTRGLMIESLYWEQLLSNQQSAVRVCRLARAMLEEMDGVRALAARELYRAPSYDVRKTAAEYAQELKRGEGVVRNLRETRISEAERKRLSEMEFDAKGIANWLTWSLERYGLLDEWKVKISSRVTEIGLNMHGTWGAEILIPETQKMNGLELLRLNGHQIDCKVRDIANTIKLLKLPKALDDRLLIGHALSADIDFDYEYVGRTARLPQPYYILAMDWASKGRSFAKVAMELLAVLPKAIGREAAQERAWQCAYKVFRGASDTRNYSGYAFMHDKAYFEGFMMKEQLRKCGWDDYVELGALGVDGVEQAVCLFEIRPGDLPYEYKDTTWRLCRRLLRA